MVHDSLDMTFFLQVSNCHPCQTPIDFQPFDQDRLTDEAEGGHFLHDTVVCGLIEGHSVDGFILDLSLGPLLLLCRFAASRGCGCCLGLRLHEKL